jgi:hypothetical protein
VIEGVSEPDHAQPTAAVGSFGHRGGFLPPYLRILARRRGEGATRRQVVLVE